MVSTTGSDNKILDLELHLHLTGQREKIANWPTAILGIWIWVILTTSIIPVITISMKGHEVMIAWMVRYEVEFKVDKKERKVIADFFTSQWVRLAARMAWNSRYAHRMVFWDAFTRTVTTNAVFGKEMERKLMYWELAERKDFQIVAQFEYVLVEKNEIQGIS